MKMPRRQRAAELGVTYVALSMLHFCMQPRSRIDIGAGLINLYCAEAQTSDITIELQNINFDITTDFSHPNLEFDLFDIRIKF